MAVIGEERNLMGFKPFGVDVFLSSERSSDTSLEEWFSSIVSGRYSLIMVTESIAEQVPEQLDALWRKDFPVVLTIRGAGPSRKLAFQRLRDLVIKAVGTDMFKETG
jgi:vacuolar-type H+-ATPase subunit F/Vma7